MKNSWMGGVEISGVNEEEGRGGDRGMEDSCGLMTKDG